MHLHSVTIVTLYIIVIAFITDTIVTLVITDTIIIDVKTVTVFI